MRDFLLTLFLVMVLLSTGCAGNETTSLSTEPQENEQNYTADTAEPQIASLFAMDTEMELTVYGGGTDLLDRAEAEIVYLEGLLSTTDPDSEVFALNRDGKGSLSPEPLDLLDQALALCRETEGALDLSIYPVVRAWGFTTGEYRVPSEDELAALLSRVNYTKIQQEGNRVILGAGMELDLGSVAKGYTGDRLLTLFREDGVTSALLNLGGNVQALGAKPDGSPWRIAVQDPSGSDYLGVLPIMDQAVITSGGYERFFELDGQVYWHIMDPATGRPARNGLVSVTVVGDSGVYCDALSTALFIMGEKKAEEFWRARRDFDLVLLTEGGRLLLTPGLADKFQLWEGRTEQVEVIEP